MSNEWDELFANAAGHHCTESAPSSPQLNRRKRKRKRPRSTHDDEFTRMLAERMTVQYSCPRVWPEWLSLGPLHTSNTVCPGWKAKTGEEELHRSCCHCSKSALHHRVQVELPNGKTTAAHIVFGSVRNIRCSASIMVTSEHKEHSLLTLAIKREMGWIHNAQHSLLSALPSGEGSLLAEKFTRLFESSNELIIQGRDGVRNNRVGSCDGIFEGIVRLVMACDVVYYRLYYLQITKALQIRDNFIFIPHPSNYFMLPYLSWDTIEGGVKLKECLRDLHSCAEESGVEKSELSTILQSYGVDESHTMPSCNDPLRALHHNRFMETVTLFYSSGWVDSLEVKAQTAEALENIKQLPDDDLSYHETPAPALLMAWRDACRDFLCNLYAYATLAPGTEERLQELLMKNNIKDGLIELGSGTGYIARVLHDAGIKIKAWDAFPTQKDSSMNEYHGCTPPFFNVREGGIGVLKSTLRMNLPTNSALLLCYPPPKSSMARDALQTFMDAGGQFLVHIGEFSGLTASREFENLLSNNFECLERTPCLNWGTNCDNATFWKRVDCREFSNPSSCLLLPCCQCGQRQSLRRCRLARNLVYCGRECCLKHEPARRIHLSLQMVAIDESMLSFQNRSHYAELQLRDGAKIAKVSNSKKKKRKRKKR